MEDEGDDEGVGVDDVDDADADGEGEGGAADRRRAAVDPSTSPGQMGRPGRAKQVMVEVVEAQDDADEGADVDGEDEAGDGDERGMVGAIGSDFVGGRGGLLAELLTHDITISHGPDPRNGEWRAAATKTRKATTAWRCRRSFGPPRGARGGP